MPNGKVAFSAILGTAGALGYTADEVWNMSVWEYSALVDGWAEVHAAGDQGLSQAEADDLWEYVRGKMERLN